MKNSFKITSWCRIKCNSFVINGQAIFQTDNASFNDFSKAAYKALEVNYPKFFKMDRLSKLAFLGADMLLRDLNPQVENNVALVLSNKSSSLDTDISYQESISDRENYFPSPAVFVYTLPNICIGEISIRHQLKSENSFFIFDAFNPEFMARYAQILMDAGKADEVVCGWVEIIGESYDAFIYRVGPEGIMAHTPQNLETLYNT